MIKKKSSFLTFCFSLLPGAGQMYMGFMRRGLSLMTAFFLLIFFSSWLNLGPLMFALPLIWFFAFFDTHNLRSMPDDEFYALEDNFIIIPEFSKEKAKLMQSQYKVILALALIIVGFTILWNNIYDIFARFLPHEIRNALYAFGRYFPQMVIGFAIILLGIYLIRGKKKDLDAMDRVTMLEDKEGKNNE